MIGPYSLSGGNTKNAIGPNQIAALQTPGFPLAKAATTPEIPQPNARTVTSVSMMPFLGR